MQHKFAQESQNCSNITCRNTKERNACLHNTACVVKQFHKKKHTGQLDSPAQFCLRTACQTVWTNIFLQGGFILTHKHSYTTFIHTKLWILMRTEPGKLIRCGFLIGENLFETHVSLHWSFLLKKLSRVETWISVSWNSSYEALTQNPHNLTITVMSARKKYTQEIKYHFSAWTSNKTKNPLKRLLLDEPSRRETFSDCDDARPVINIIIY